MKSSCFALIAAGCLLAWGAPAAAQEFHKLSDVLKEFDDDPKTVDEVLERLGDNPAAAGFISPVHRRFLRAAIKRKDWAAIDRFPAMTVAELGRTVRAVGAAEKAKRARGAVQKPKTLQGGGEQQDPLGLGAGPSGTKKLATTEPLGIPAGGAAPKAAKKDLGHGLQMGDSIDPEKAKRYANSKRLAEVLNRLARNDPASTADRYQVEVNGGRVHTIPALLAALQKAGHTVEVRDARYFANFGDLSWKNKDVATPFWVDTEIKVPGQRRNLLVPVSHSQHEVIVRGPKVNADVSFFFGIDGHAMYRPMVGKGQGWTAGTTKRVYKGKQALEAARIAGEIHREYVNKKAKHPTLPFGGYYTLGVCNDVNAMIELHMTGETTLYPITRDRRYFLGKGEVNQLGRKLPVDGRRRSKPDLKRVLGSLPVSDLDDLAFPGLRKDVQAFKTAGTQHPGITELPIFKD